MRFRVTALATLAVVAVLGLTGVVLVSVQSRLLTENLDEALAIHVGGLAARAEEGDLASEVVGPGDDDSVAQVVAADGRIAAASPNVVGRGPVARPPDGREQRRTVDDIPTDAGRFRLLSRRVDTPEGAVVVHSATTLEDIDESAAVLRRSLSVAVPTMALLLAALVWWLVGRTLRPVEAIRAEVADIGGGDLHRRVPEPGTDDEIGRLATTMNAMLDRVERAARRQQQFTADASHELRGPLTRIRSEIEVDQAHPDTADLAGTHQSVLAETIGLQHLVDDLLHLARRDAGAGPARADDVDLDDLVGGHARRLRDADRVAVDTSGVSGAQVRGDARQLDRAVGNVVENAGRHAASTVTLAVAERGGGAAVVTVADDGPGIAPGDRERVFERFTRLDQSRTAGAGGAGLGLAIAATSSSATVAPSPSPRAPAAGRGRGDLASPGLTARCPTTRGRRRSAPGASGWWWPPRRRGAGSPARELGQPGSRRRPRRGRAPSDAHLVVPRPQVGGQAHGLRRDRLVAQVVSHQVQQSHAFGLARSSQLAPHLVVGDLWYDHLLAGMELLLKPTVDRLGQWVAEGSKWPWRRGRSALEGATFEPAGLGQGRQELLAVPLALLLGSDLPHLGQAG